MTYTNTELMKRWTEKEVAELRRLKPSMTNSELADIFGTTPGAVAWGEDNAQSLINSNINGRYINLSFNSPTT